MKPRAPLCGPVAVLLAMALFAAHAAAQSADSARTNVAAQTADSAMTSVAALRISSEPDSAIVFLDGRRVGATPLVLEGLARGPHTIRLVVGDPGNWFSDVTRDSLFLEPGSDRQVHYRLDHRYAIMTAPSGAEVLIGDSVAGTTPILVPYELARSGNVRVRLKGYAEVGVTVPPDGGSAVVLQLTPEKGAGPGVLQPVEAGSRLTSILITAGSVAISGAAAAYFKVSADEKNTRYLAPETRPSGPSETSATWTRRWPWWPCRSPSPCWSVFSLPNDPDGTPPEGPAAGPDTNLPPKTRRKATRGPIS